MKIDRDKLYPWLAILRAKYMGSDRARRLVEHFGSIEKALHAPPSAIAALPGLSGQIGQAVHEAAQGKFDAEIDKELTWAQKEGISILLPSDSGYPPLLKYIHSYPAVLYVKGKLLPQDILAFAIVGSRRASAAGRRRTNTIANELAEAGLTIVSGLAWGIDAAAHKGALKCKSGRTIAVMGNGLQFIYPREHTLLADQIVKRGAIVTELFYNVSPQGRNFPPRNRIISGLSLGVLIAEAPEHSGALITANYALEQGKDIFALPGSVDEDTARGCNKLIRESGAKLVTSTKDILDELGDKITYYHNELAGNIPHIQSTEPETISIKEPKTQHESISIHESKPVEKPATSPSKPPAPEKPNIPISADEETTLKILTDEPKHIDVIARELEWPVSRVSSALGLLELKKLIERESGMRFRILDT